MSLYLDLKAAITVSGLKLKDVNDELNRRHGTDLSFQNFSNRIRKGKFLYIEVQEILDIIGYDIIWQKRNE